MATAANGGGGQRRRPRRQADRAHSSSFILVSFERSNFASYLFARRRFGASERPATSRSHCARRHRRRRRRHRPPPPPPPPLPSPPSPPASQATAARPRFANLAAIGKRGRIAAAASCGFGDDNAARADARLAAEWRRRTFLARASAPRVCVCVSISAPHVTCASVRFFSQATRFDDEQRRWDAKKKRRRRTRREKRVFASASR